MESIQETKVICRNFISVISNLLNTLSKMPSTKLEANTQDHLLTTLLLGNYLSGTQSSSLESLFWPSYLLCYMRSLLHLE
jgi:hypothetical protein